MAGSRAMQEQLPSVVGYIVCFSNILLFLITIIVLGETCSVPMKYPGLFSLIFFTLSCKAYRGGSMLDY